jgi:hypothetical protein
MSTTAYWERVSGFRRLVDDIDSLARHDPRLLDAFRNDAGCRQASTQLQHLAALLPAFAPAGDWSLSVPADQRYPAEFLARTMAALTDPGVRHCQHVRQGAQPIAALGFRAVLCHRCTVAAIEAGQDPADADRCDWCGRRRVKRFTPIATTGGPLLIFGSACEACARVLLPAGGQVEMQPKGWG